MSVEEMKQTKGMGGHKRGSAQTQRNPTLIMSVLDIKWGVQVRCGRCCLCTPGAIFRNCVHRSVETADVRTCVFLSVDAAMSLCNIEVKLKKIQVLPWRVYPWRIYCCVYVVLRSFRGAADVLTMTQLTELQGPVSVLQLIQTSPTWARENANEMKHIEKIC